MPVIAAVTINDGAATPVAHTFTPLGRDANGVYWWEQTSPVPVNKLAAKRLSYKQTRELDVAKQLTSVSRANYTLWVPTMETLASNSSGFTPPATVAYKEVGRCSFELPERGLTQERKDTRVLMLNLLGHAMVVSNVDSLEPSYTA